MVMFWVSLLAISILLYVLLDGFDLGVGMLFGLTSNETRRRAMLGAVAPIWDGNETWLVVTAVILWGAFPAAYATLLPAFYLPLLVMLALAWLGSYLSLKDRIERNRFLLWLVFLSFPLPFIAILTGWYTAEVGRQPWVVYGVLRTADAMTPFLTARAATISLVVFSAVYTFIFAFGIFYIYRLLRAGPAGHLIEIPSGAVPNRPMSLADEGLGSDPKYVGAGE